MPLPETRQSLHLQTLQDIARERFSFPNDDYPHLKTFLNDPQHTMAVPAGREALLQALKTARRGRVA